MKRATWHTIETESPSRSLALHRIRQRPRPGDQIKRRDGFVVRVLDQRESLFGDVVAFLATPPGEGSRERLCTLNQWRNAADWGSVTSWREGPERGGKR